MIRIARVLIVCVFAALLAYGAIMVSECRGRTQEIQLVRESALRRYTLGVLWDAIESYRTNHHRWPSSNEELLSDSSVPSDLDALRDILLQYRVRYDRLERGRVQVLVDDPGYTVAYHDVGPWRLCLLTDGRIVSFAEAQQYR